MAMLTALRSQNATSRNFYLWWSLGWGVVIAAVAFAVIEQLDRAALIALLLVPPLVWATWLFLRSKRDVTAFASLIIALAVLIPAKLVFEPLGGSATPAILLGVLAFGIWWVGRIVPLGFARDPNPVRVAALVFAWVQVAAWGATFTRPVQGIEIRAADRGLITILGAVGICLLVLDGVTSRDRLETLLRRLVLFGCVLAAFGIVQFIFGYDITEHVSLPVLKEASEGTIQLGERSDFRRVGGTTLHPIEFGVVLAMIFPIALYLAFDAATKAHRKFGMFAAVFIGSALPMSISRSAFVALGVSLLIMVPSWNVRRIVNFGGIAVVAAVAIRVAFPGLLGTVRSLFTSIFVDTSITHRGDYANDVGGFIRQAPFFGRGLHTYLPEFFSTFDNQYFLSVVETGILGLLALVAFWVTGFLTARGAVRRAIDPQTKSLAAAVSAACAVPIVTSATFDFLSFPVATTVAFLLVGVSGACWRITKQEQELHELVSA